MFSFSPSRLSNKHPLQILALTRSPPPSATKPSVRSTSWVHGQWSAAPLMPGLTSGHRPAEKIDIIIMQLYIQWTTNSACKVKNKNINLKCQEAKTKSFGCYSITVVAGIYYYCVPESQTKMNNRVYQISRIICLEYTLSYVNIITIVLRLSSLNKSRTFFLVLALYRRLRTEIWLRGRCLKHESVLPVIRYPRSLRWATGLAPTPWVPELILSLMPSDGG